MQCAEQREKYPTTTMPYFVFYILVSTSGAGRISYRVLYKIFANILNI